MLTFILANSLTAVESMGTAYTVDGTGAVTLGRGNKADVRIKSPNLSRSHLRFIPTSQGWSIEDLGSKNGSNLNSARIEAIKPLQAGDRIQAGDCFIEIAGVSAPIDGPKQIEVASLGNQINELPTEKITPTDEADSVKEDEAAAAKADSTDEDFMQELEDLLN